VVLGKTARCTDNFGCKALSDRRGNREDRASHLGEPFDAVANCNLQARGKDGLRRSRELRLADDLSEEERVPGAECVRAMSEPIARVAAGNSCNEVLDIGEREPTKG